MSLAEEETKEGAKVVLAGGLLGRHALALLLWGSVCVARGRGSTCLWWLSGDRDWSLCAMWALGT